MSTVSSRVHAWARTEVVPSRAARQVIGVLVFAVATALSARIAIPLPGTPVPFTFQPLLVILSGALLGARLGAFSQTAYLAAGIAGLPVFVAGGGVAYLLGPTAGYLMAYPLAAWVAGAVVGSGALRATLGLLSGLAVIYAGGVAWLTATGSLSTAILFGLQPFVLADLVKVMLGAVIVVRARNRSLELFAR